MGPSTLADKLTAWGNETLDMIEAHYKIPDSGLYADAYNANSPLRQPAFCWGVGVQLSALNAACDLEKSRIPRLKSFADDIQKYWYTAPPVPGFDVLPNPTDQPDRYYDDNAWMVMSLSEASRRTRSNKYLVQAEQALTYVLSGEDSVLGGGIYWKEREKTSKNTCSNGPSAAACLAVYQLNHDKVMLAKAQSIYAWCKGNLQDPADSLYWDNMNVSGKIEKTKWSYNTALMIRTAAELFRITKSKSYGEDVKAMAKSSADHWFDPQSGTIKDGGRFAHLLIESWLYAARDVPGTFEPDRLKEITTRPLEYIHEHGRLNGFYSNRWDKPDAPDTVRFELIDQASAARAFFEVAKYYKGR